MLLATAFAVVANVAPVPLRALVIACRHDAANMRFMREQLRAEPLIEADFFNQTCNAAQRSTAAHCTAVHWSHVRALRQCAARNWRPCLILEADATWQGDLGSAALGALSDIQGMPWDVVTFGVVATHMHRIQMRRLGQHAFLLDGTTGGCHGYLARKPAALAAYLAQRRPVRPTHKLPLTPCIEQLRNFELDVVLAVDVPVLQRNKYKYEGRSWLIAPDNTFKYHQCSINIFIKNLLQGSFRHCDYEK